MQNSMFVIYKKDQTDKPATLVVSEKQVKHSKLFEQYMNRQIKYYYTDYNLEKIKNIFVYYQRPDLVWFETKSIPVLIEYLEITYNLRFTRLWKHISNHLANALNGKTATEMSSMAGLPVNYDHAVNADIKKINFDKHI